MAGGGGGQHTTATTYTNSLPEYAEPYYESLMERAQRESGRPYQTYPGQRVADIAEQTHWGLGKATDWANTHPDWAKYSAEVADAAGAIGLDAINFTPDTVYNPNTGPQTQSYQPGAFDPSLINPDIGYDGGQAYQPGQYVSSNFDPSLINPDVGFGGGIEYLPTDINLPTVTAPEMADVADAVGGTASAGQGRGYAVNASFDAHDYTYDPVTNTYRGPQSDYDAGDFTYDETDFRRFDENWRDFYMSPYMDEVIANAQRDAARAYQIEEAMRNADAAVSGVFGGSRYALQQQLGRSDLQNRLSDILVEGKQSAYLNAQQQFERDEQRKFASDRANQAADLQTQSMGEQSRQFAYQVPEQFRQAAGQMDLQAALANQQAGIETQRLGDLSRQFGANLGYMASRDTAANMTQASLANAQMATQASIASANNATTASIANMNAATQRAITDQAVKLQTQGMNLDASLEQAKMDVMQNQFGADLDLQQGIEAGRQGIQIGTLNQASNQWAQDLAEQSRQFGANLGEQSRQFGANLDFQQDIEATRQGIEIGSLNQSANQWAQNLGEQSRQFGTNTDLALDQLREQAYQMDMQAQLANQQAGISALSLGLQGAGLGLNASQQMMASQAAQDRAYQDRIRAMLGVGQYRQDLQQRQHDLAYEDFINQRDQERQTLQFLSSILQGVPISANQNVMTSQPTNPFQGLLGSAAGIEALYGLGRS